MNRTKQYNVMFTATNSYTLKILAQSQSEAKQLAIDELLKIFNGNDIDFNNKVSNEIIKKESIIIHVNDRDNFFKRLYWFIRLFFLETTKLYRR